MKAKYLNIILFALVLSFTAVPVSELASQSVVERISKRFFKKNKLKRTGKKLVNMGKAAPLEDMALEPGMEVVGFEPSWMIETGAFADHYFNLLSTLVVGEYDINPTTGATRNRNNLRLHLEKQTRDKTAKQDMNIIQKADFHNPKIKILLNLTYYGDYGQEARQRAYVKQLITDPEIHRTLKDSIQSYFIELREIYNIPGDRAGIVIDFQLDNNSYNADFVDFVNYLRNELGDEHLIYMKIPAKYRKDALIPANIIQDLEPAIDKFIVKGYGFENYAKDYSPTVVFDKNSSYSIDGTLMSYMLPGYEEIILEKFIVELPYYGVLFKRDSQGNYFLKEGSPYITIDNFNKDIRGRSGTLKYRNDNTMAYYMEGDSLAYIVEDSTSLASKYFYLRDTLQMNGFAINALGYYVRPDNAKRSEGWAAIADNFGEEREKLGWVIAFYLTAFLPIGFVFSVFRYWEVRNALAKFNNYWNRFQLFFLLSILIFLTCSGILPRGIFVVIGLIIMGIFILYIFIKKALMRSKKYVNLVK